MKINPFVSSFLVGSLNLISIVKSSLFHPSQIPINAGTNAKIPQSQFTDPESKLVNLHQDLISIESITGNEYEISQYLHSYLSSRNFTVETQYVSSTKLLHDVDNIDDKPRLNIFAYKGTTRSTRILITTHMDTVGPYIPYSRSSNGKGNEICGRGSTDAKGCMASQIMAVEELIAEESIQEGDIGLLFVVGEETNGAGMGRASEIFQQDGLGFEAVIFGEPSENKLVIGHKGALAYEIIAHGKDAHSSYPELGINAISILIKVLAAIDEMKLPGSVKLGETTTSIGLIEGGVAMNVIPAKASATVLTRLAAGTPETVIKRIETIIANLGFDEGRVEVKFGFETDVKRGGTDVPNLKGNHKRYLIGPGSVLSAHSDHECITVDGLVKGVNDYKRIIRSLIAR
ncbi:ee9ba5a4-af08-41ea-948d-12d734534440 [Sclerotinia trifoliorum]|uniref:Ee9ba5a4-af08-41ea-948d-12d734534440 n=1 Tax=Sclerotinia trifoliorum TaxID=28548 RepID=A0A8H2ZP69_9HELO|nr:ee9ba5a4-af08-41ea-948d-12d734534440 [Sclerotinia trifoliorum]